MTTHDLMARFTPLLLPLAIGFGFRVILLTISLFILLKAQAQQHSVLGVLVSAGLASVFDMIPLIGHPIAVVVLLGCVLVMTKAHLMDVRFTVGISYAVTFLLQMLILALLPGNLKVNARAFKPMDFIQATTNAAPASETTSTNKMAKANGPAQPAAGQNTMNNAASGAAASAVPASAAKAPAHPPVPWNDIVGYFRLKGVVNNAEESTATIYSGTKSYTMKVGEVRSMENLKGVVDVKLQAVNEGAAVLSVNGEEVTLHFQ